MGRFGSFMLGVVVGAGLAYGAFNYHVLRADEGLQLVAKITPGLEGTYVDIRGFGFEDWNRHRGLAVALVKADKAHLMTDAATAELREAVETWRKKFHDPDASRP
jgi:hypothetical protein